MSDRIAHHPRRKNLPALVSPAEKEDGTKTESRGSRPDTVVDMRSIHQRAQTGDSEESYVVSYGSSDDELSASHYTTRSAQAGDRTESEDADFTIHEDSPASNAAGAAGGAGAPTDPAQGTAAQGDAYEFLEPLLSPETKELLQEYREKSARHKANTDFGAPSQLLWSAAASQPIFVGALGIPGLIGKAVGIPQLLLLGGPLIGYGALPLVLNLYSGFARSPDAEEYNKQMKLLARAVRDLVSGKSPSLDENRQPTDAWSRFDLDKLRNSYLGKSVTDDLPFLLLILAYFIKAATPTLADGHHFGNHTPADHTADGPYRHTFYDRKTTLGPVRDALLHLAAGSAAITSVTYIGQLMRYQAHPELYVRRPSADVLDTEIRLLQAIRMDLQEAENRLLRIPVSPDGRDDSDADAPTDERFSTPESIYAQQPSLQAKIVANRALLNMMDTKLGADYRALFGAKAANAAATAGGITLLLVAVMYANMQTAKLVQQEHTLEHQLMSDMVGPAVLGVAILIRNEAINLVRVGVLAPLLGLGDRLGTWWSGADADGADDNGNDDTGLASDEEGYTTADEDGYL